MATYDNDLRLKEIATGDEEGTWGASTNVNLELIAEAFSYDTLAITGSQNLTLTDGGTAAARALFLKVTGTLSGNATLTIDPNSVSKVWAIQNATTGGYSLILSQGSGSTVTVAASRTKIIYSDGGGASANVVEVTTALDLSSFTAGNTTLISSILDEDNMASDSATALATQQSIKAYVDSQVTAQDLDFAGDTGIGAVDLDSQTFTVAGTSNEVETSASAQTITIGLPANVTVTTALTTPTVKATNLSANDGTASASIANSTGVMTVASSVLTTTDINAGTIDGTTIGGSSAAAATVTTLTANTNLTIAGTTTVDGVIDDDTMATASATKLATSESIKAYVDSQVGTVDTLAEILANGNTSGGTNLIMSAGDTLTVNTIAETTVGAGVTIDSVLLKDDVVNATDIEVSTISANDGVQSAVVASATGVMTIASSVLTTTDINGGTIDGTTIGGATPAVGTFTTANATTVDTTNLEVTTLKAKDGTSAGSIADATGVVTLASSVLTTTDINGGTVDGAVIGGASAAAGTFTTLTANTNLTIAGTTTVNGVIDDDTMATASATKLATSESIKAYVDSQVTAQDLDFAGDSGTGQVDLDSQTFTIAGTANEIETSASGQTITVGLPNSVTIASDLTIAKTTGQLIAANSATTGGVYQRFSNTSGSVVVGLESSTGGSIISGTSANAAIIGTDLAQSVQICTNNAPNLTIASGGAATFSNSLSVTGNLTVDTNTLFVDAVNNRVGIGTSPSYKLDVAGTAAISGDVTLSGGTANGVAYLSGSKVLTTGSSLTFDGNSLGVATSAGNMALFNSTAANGGYLTIQRSGVSKGYIGSAAQLSGGSNDDFAIRAEANLVFSLIASEQMRLTSTGLGIGKSPNYKLDVQGVIQAGDGTYGLQVGTGWGGAPTNTYLATNGASTQIVFGINGSEKMRIDSSGKVGIGEALPGARLQVKGFGGLSGLTFQTTDYLGNEIFYIQDGGTVGLNFYPFRIGIPSGTASATNAVFQIEEAGILTALWTGDVGIGTTSPGAKLDVSDTTGNNLSLNVTNNDGYVSIQKFEDDAYWNLVDTGDMIWRTGTSPSEKMRLTSGGTLCVGAVFSSAFIQAKSTSATTSTFNSWNSATSGTIYHFEFRDGASATSRGSITTDGSNTSFNTSSDRRLKEDIVPAPEAGALIDAMSVMSFNWKSDGSHTRFGMIAQDLYKIAPEAINAGDDSDKIENVWGVDYSKLVPMLTKEIQSLRARVASLEMN